MFVLAAPGQGAQAAGFLTPWLELPGFADRLAAWSDLAGCDLIAAGTVASAEEIRDTAVAQPLLVAAALAATEAVYGDLGHPRRQGGIAAGHSVGELAAGAIAGVLTPEDAMHLIAVRSRAMAQAAAAEETGMTAVLGGNEAEVLAAIEACGLTPANINATGQVVAAGTLAQLAALAADPPAGARLRPLSVAGAFHSPHMALAVSALREAAAGIDVADPEMVLVSNLDGAAVKSGADWLERIIAQVSAPVRWKECMGTMADLDARAFVELLPGGTLTGLAKRALPGVATVALKAPDDLAAARSLLAEHGAADPDENGHLPEWRLLVAPHDGTFRAGHPGQAGQVLAPGAAVSSGAELGHVEVRSGQHAIAPTFGGIIIEWLVEDGDPVNAGQPLVRLQPEGAE